MKVRQISRYLNKNQVYFAPTVQIFTGNVRFQFIIHSLHGKIFVMK